MEKCPVNLFILFFICNIIKFFTLRFSLFPLFVLYSHYPLPVSFSVLHIFSTFSTDFSTYLNLHSFAFHIFTFFQTIFPSFSPLIFSEMMRFLFHFHILTAPTTTITLYYLFLSHLSPLKSLFKNLFKEKPYIKIAVFLFPFVIHF